MTELNNPIETDRDFLQYEKECQFKNEQENFYKWLDETHNNSLLHWEKYVCPFCGKVETHTVYSEITKTKYLLWCPRCNRAIRKLSTQEVETLPKPLYGVWNDLDKRFVFGLRESDPNVAWNKFKKKCSGWRKWRYSVKPIPLKQLIEERKNG